MSKDSQPDDKRTRTKKSSVQTSITHQKQNQNPNGKKKSIQNDDV